MRKLRIGVIDILSNSAGRKAWGRFIRANYASIMPQVVAVWCEELGHDVFMSYYNGPELMAGERPDGLDVVFVHAYTNTAMLAYAMSNYLRSKGAITVIGGPHTRSYPEDAAKYFDYVVGLCDKDLIRDILQDVSQYRPVGQYVSADQQLSFLPGVRERWRFITPILEEAKIVKGIAVIGSLGCPYTCSFCREAFVPFQPLDFECLKQDLRFIYEQKVPRSIVGWHDPNFGVRFDDYMGTIEEAVPPGSLRFAAESSLALLNEEHCKRLARNGFKVILPGIESWFDMGAKSRVGRVKGLEKVKKVAEQANMIVSYIPYLQTNLIFGLDADEGPEPFELTKKFIDLAPGVYPLFSLLTSYGSAAVDNLRYQEEGRILNIPFHFLNQLHSLNVQPKHYTWSEIFGQAADVVTYAYSSPVLVKRFRANRNLGAGLEQLLRGVSSGRNLIQRNFERHRDRLHDPVARRYFDGETSELPAFFIDPIRYGLQWLWDWLPDGAIYHDPYAYINASNGVPGTRTVYPGKTSF